MNLALGWRTGEQHWEGALFSAKSGLAGAQKVSQFAAGSPDRDRDELVSMRMLLEDGVYRGWGPVGSL